MSCWGRLGCGKDDEENVVVMKDEKGIVVVDEEDFGGGEEKDRLTITPAAKHCAASVFCLFF